MTAGSLAAAEAAVAIDPSDPYQRMAQTHPQLGDDQLARAVAFGTIETHPAGTVLFTRGQRVVDFFVVLDGSVEIVAPGPEGGHILTVHGPGQFTGELDHFNTRNVLVGGRIGPDGGRVARLDRRAFRRLLAAESDIAEIVMRAFILRRVGLIRHAEGAVALIGPRRSGDGLRIERFLRRNGYPVRPLEADVPEARAALAEAGLGEADLPAVVCAPGKVLSRPSNVQLGLCLGITEALDDSEVFDLVVVGAGPAGLAAAVYGASEGLRTIVIEGEAPGGQAGTSSKIENYLGFPTGISGQALAGRAQVQAQKFGARIEVPRRAVRLHCDGRPYALELDDGSRVRARAVVVATGAHYRRLDVPGFARLEGDGVHYAATAIEAALCERQEVVIVGGGNSAGQAAVFLARHAAHVHILVRGEGLAESMSDYLVGRIDASERITLHTRTEVTALLGERHLERVRWVDRRTGREEEREVGALFLMLGAVPNTDWLEGCVTLDPQGFVVSGHAFDPALAGRQPFALEASRPGVFAVGDVRAGSIKRVASGVGEGSVVVSSVHQVLAEEM